MTKTLLTGPDLRRGIAIAQARLASEQEFGAPRLPDGAFESLHLIIDRYTALLAELDRSAS